jgi:hypothetical protein
MVEFIVEGLHLVVEFRLAGVCERRVADVMGQSQSLGEAFVEFQDAGDSTRDLGDFNGVCESIPKMVRESGGEYLGLVFEPTKGTSVNDAVAITLEFGPVGMGGFRVAAAPAALSRETQAPE